MSLGGVSVTLVTGGAKIVPGGADLARTIVGLGVCTVGTPATLYHPGSSGAVRSGLGLSGLPEMLAPIFNVSGAPSPYGLPLTPSTAGGLSSVTHTGASLATIVPTAATHVSVIEKCITGGTLGTATFRYSLDGGTTYGILVTSESSAPWVYRVPGTFLSLSHAAATYVATKTNTYNLDGTTTSSSGWVGTVTATASPVDDYNVVCTPQIAGGLGTATIAVSLDGGRTQYGPPLLTPSGGVVVVPGTGLVLTCAVGSGNFIAGEPYSFCAAKPAPTPSDITTAITAMLADATAPNAAVLVLDALPSAAATAFTLAQTLETALETAFAAGKDWLAVMTCPLAGDIINLSGTIQIDTADTRAVVKAARAGVNTPRVSVFSGTDYMQSAIGSYQSRRTRSTTFAARIAGKLPVEADRSSVAARDASLVAAIGDDERSATVSLYDAQVNTYVTESGDVVLTIGTGYYGWQNCTTDANEVDADGFRAVNAILAGFRPVCAKMVGRKYPLNSDGTIEAKTRGGLDTMLDAAIKKKAGFGVGGDFGGVPQVSSITAALNPATNLGPTGDKVIKVNGSVLALGFGSAVAFTLYFQGA